MKAGIFHLEYLHCHEKGVLAVSPRAQLHLELKGCLREQIQNVDRENEKIFKASLPEDACLYLQPLLSPTATPEQAAR